MFNTQNFDVAVIGGGMVGLATAVGLAQEGIRTLVIDAGETQTVTGEPRLRVSAVNKAGTNLLKNLGAWQYIDEARTGMYDTMHVWTKDGLGAIDFNSKQQNETVLGNIIENDNISHALATRAGELAELTHIQNQRVSNIAFGDKETWISLDSGDNLTASVVIAADGANSRVREQCKIPLIFWDYDHHAIVANIRTALPHDNCARQVFLEDGPLAFLPLNEPDLCSIVWSVTPEKARMLQAMEPEDFNKTLTADFDGKLGLCKLESDSPAFPLRMRYARQFARHRLILAGDAAHTIHPLAGQGVNLGFLDAGGIIETLAELKKANQDLGEYRNLRSLERWRKAEAVEMITAMEGLKRLFTGSNPVKKALRDFGLNLVDQISPIKDIFAKHALGHKVKMPRLCK